MEKSHDNMQEKFEKGQGSSLKERLLDSLYELIVAAVAFAIGMGILPLLGVKDTMDQRNPETVILVGILGMIGIAGIAVAVVALIKKKKNKR